MDSFHKRQRLGSTIDTINKNAGQKMDLLTFMMMENSKKEERDREREEKQDRLERDRDERRERLEREREERIERIEREEKKDRMKREQEREDRAMKHDQVIALLMAKLLDK